MQDQRKELRRKLIAFTPVYELPHKTLIGYVGDLTPQGILVIGERPFVVDRRLTLDIDFPDDTSESHTAHMTISGRAAWCRPDTESPQYFHIGFEFFDISPENEKIIGAILDRYQFRYEMDASELKR